jgi:CBS domain-containing protein
MLLMCAPSLGFLLIRPAPAAVRCRASAPTMGILDFMKAPEQRDEPKTDREPPFPGSKALVSEVMAPLDKLVTLRPDQTLQEAGRTLVKADITGAPVLDEEGDVVGVLSRTDLLFQVAGAKSLLPVGTGPRSERYVDNSKRIRKIEGQFVGCAMSPNPVAIRPSATLQEAAGMMLRRRLNRLIVTEDGTSDGHLCGTVSSSAVVRLALECDEP